VAKPSATDFPSQEFVALVRRLPGYARLAWALAHDPRVSRARRLAVLAGAAYVISPIDLVPGFIPVAGQLDDLLVGLTAIRIGLDGLRPEFRAERLSSVGFTQADLDHDIQTTKAVAVWIGRSGVRVGRKMAAEAVGVGRRLTTRVAALRNRS
jgi:uncharacterized membrane protein YkvA (DUF1232 family)